MSYEPVIVDGVLLVLWRELQEESRKLKDGVECKEITANVIVELQDARREIGNLNLRIAELTEQSVIHRSIVLQENMRLLLFVNLTEIRSLTDCAHIWTSPVAWCHMCLIRTALDAFKVKLKEALDSYELLPIAKDLEEEEE